MSISLRLGAALAVASALVPAAALAQTGAAYTPPTLTKQGSSTSAAAGAGTVTVQVFVKKDGTFQVSRVLKSTNAGDNDAALQIAKSAQYRAAVRDGRPVDAYYDYNIRFTSGGVVGADTPSAGSGATATAYAAIRAGKYADAKTQLQAYLQNHPDDVQANTLLGVADAFAGDNAGAAAAFDHVPSIPANYTTLAVQAYTKDAGDQIAAHNTSAAIAEAGHVIALQPESADGYYLRGVAEGNAQNFQAALPDLQKALAIARAGKADAKSLATIDFSLAVAQLNTGAYDMASVTAKDAVQFDPSLQPKLDAAVYTAIMNGAIALANGGHTADAVAQLDRGAALFPHQAGALYGQASYIMLTDKAPDYKKLKAEADKALAADPANGRALFVEAFVAAQAGDSKTAADDMNKAKASPLYGSDPTFAKQVDDNLKKINSGLH